MEAGLLLDTLASRLVEIRQRTAGRGSTSDSPAGSDDDGCDSDHATDAHPGPVVDVGPGPAQSENVSAATHSSGPTCLPWCPVCRTAELLNGDRPELAATLIDTAALLVGTLRALIPDAPAPDAALRQHAKVPSAGAPADEPGDVGGESGRNHRGDVDLPAAPVAEPGAGTGPGTAARVQRIEIR